MKIYILGICGTFMAGIAALAKEMGYEVSGCDEHVYPPMSTHLERLGITVHEGYDSQHIIDAAADQIIVGNVIKRGNPSIEYVLNQKLTYISGPQWLAENVLKQRQVIAVAGTHGKTTTATMIAWILQTVLSQKNDATEVGFLIGGLPQNFNQSARLGNTDVFVIEADEYDAAFFDKRSKFVHYQPSVCVLNNLEFDHADIFNSIDDIKRQFHHLIRTIPGNGTIISNDAFPYLNEVLTMGCWTPTIKFNCRASWHYQRLADDGSHFTIMEADKKHGKVNWSLIGEHNMSNALAAIIAAQAVGIHPAQAIIALNDFKNVKRRLEIRHVINTMTIYDDFAHHPTAISKTIAALRAKVGNAKIIALVEPACYTMRHATQQQDIIHALRQADYFMIKSNSLSTDQILTQVKKIVEPNSHILVMSNRDFDNIHQRLPEILRKIR
ncbi:MAG: UDP-N-acetylmuramate:L-alanyl-gamma-D-glutamyl-meso-diaminopimelate ligase [Pseudomonadota bacterium]